MPWSADVPKDSKQCGIPISCAIQFPNEQTNRLSKVACLLTKQEPPHMILTLHILLLPHHGIATARLSADIDRYRHVHASIVSIHSNCPIYIHKSYSNLNITRSQILSNWWLHHIMRDLLIELLQRMSLCLFTSLLSLFHTNNHKTY